MKVVCGQRGARKSERRAAGTSGGEGENLRKDSHHEISAHGRFDPDTKAPCRSSCGGEVLFCWGRFCPSVARGTALE